MIVKDKPGEFSIFYRDTCGKCRFLSVIAVLISFGILKRVAISSLSAQDLYERYPKSRGKLMLVLNGRYLVGNDVPKYIPLTIFYWLAYRYNLD